MDYGSHAPACQLPTTTRKGIIIRAILVNPIYVGDMVWNRRTDGRFHRISEGHAVDREDVHGARLVPNRQQDWIVVRDTHPPLVSRRGTPGERKRQMIGDRQEWMGNKTGGLVSTSTSITGWWTTIVGSSL